MKQLYTTLMAGICLIVTHVNATHKEPTGEYHVGQHFILTLPEQMSPKDLATWLEQCKPGGILLLESHCNNKKKTKKLIEHLQQTALKIGIPPLIVAVDWEGGIISRMHEEGGFQSVPSPYTLARIGRSACFCAGLIIGKQLREIGVSCDFAPSVDLFNKDIPTLATRCFSDDPAKVAQDALAFSHGLMTQGIMPAIKHFPGLGLGVGDTHIENVAVTINDVIFKRQTDPFFECLQAGIPCVMGSHLRCAQCDNVPASLSQKALDMCKQANPNVLCITDDFSMKGIGNEMPLTESVISSLQAGYRLIIYKGTAEEEKALLNAVHEELTNKLDCKEICKRAADEVKKIKEQILGIGNSLQSDKIVDIPISEKFVQDLARASVQITNRRNRLFSRSGKSEIHLITVDLPKIRPFDSWFIDSDRTSYLSRTLKFMTGRTINEHVLNPLDNQSVARIEDILHSMKPYDDTIIQTFFFGNGAWNEIQTMWLEVIQRLAKQNQVTVFSLGHPSEQVILPKATLVQVGSYHHGLIDAALQRLSHQPAIAGTQKFALNPECYIKEHRYGLFCTRASYVTVNGKRTFLPDLLHTWAREQEDQTRLAALFCPEDGLQADDRKASSELVSRWGCPVHVLSGRHNLLCAEVLKGLDLIVIDLQDVGVRCFSYIGLMIQLIEEAKKLDIDVLVLDRPNPLSCWDASGPHLDELCESYLGRVYVPFIYGTTIGELAKEANKKIEARLTVVACSGDIHNEDYFYEQFTAPSPWLTHFEAMRAYPITAAIEGTNYSEGKGTPYAFQQIGAPWVNAEKLARALNEKKCKGVFFEAISFTPHAESHTCDDIKHDGQVCHGVFVHLIDVRVVEPTKVGRILLEKLFEMYPEQSLWANIGKLYTIDLLIGTPDWRAEINANLLA